MTLEPLAASGFETEEMREADAKSGFRSGTRVLDDFLARHAYSNQQRGIGITYILRRRPDDPSDWPAVLGYYTLSMSTLTSDQATNAAQQAFPRYPIPVALVGRLAVDQRARGAGLGSLLLGDALRRVLGVAEHIGCIGLVVDAIDSNAESFYAHHAFALVEATEYPRRMFLGLDTARAVLE